MASGMFISVRRVSTALLNAKKKVCIVGGGPAGFYAAQHLVKHLQDVQIDIIEKYPVPFGLVRFGVAPDHPEVKNVINTFTKTALNEGVNFYGNIILGKDVALSQLRENYHAVLLAYGAEQDKEFGIQNEKATNVISARKFVGWYNGIPGDQNLKVDLSGSSVAVLGQGNVAMDVARMLLTPVDILKKTDITEHALAALSRSSVKNVHLIGRRGPLQAAFTIKELREQLKLPHCQTVWREQDFNSVRDVIKDLPRPRKRITELMIKDLEEKKNEQTKDFKRFLPVFFRSPVKFLSADSGRVIAVEMSLNKLMGEDYLTQTCVSSEQREILNCDLVLRSIGYKSVQADPDIHFDALKGYVVNDCGRVLDTSCKLFDRGLYVTGWLRTGPLGVILTTMSNAFEVAENICNDFNGKDDVLKSGVVKEGFEGVRKILNRKNVQVVDWKGWERIDKYEVDAGKVCGKSREKICDVEKMLEVCS